MKKVIIGWVLLLSLTVFFSPSSVEAVISLDFVPSSQIVTVGGSAEVGIKISGLGDLIAPSLGTYDITIAFNPAVLAFNSVVYGDPILGDQLDLFSLGSLTGTTPGVGSVNLFELSFDTVDDLNNLQAADFILATLSYDAIGVGISPLTFSAVLLGDANGDALTATTSNGSVTVESAVTALVPEPSTMVLVALGLWLLAWNRARLFPNNNLFP